MANMLNHALPWPRRRRSKSLPYFSAPILTSVLVFFNSLFWQTPTSTAPTTSPTVAPSTSTSLTVVNGSPSTIISVVSATGQQGGALNGADNSGGSSSFFDNSGAVGGTFAAVGIVAVLILAGIAWLFYRRRKAQRMDADVAMAASAAAATKRTPFDDDDPEMIEDPSYGAGAAGAGSAQYYPTSQNEYEPSQFSSGTTPGYAGMGAYGPTTAAAAAAGGMAGAAGYNDYYGGNGSQGHYYDHPGSQPGDYYGGVVGSQSQGHEGVYSQGHYNPDEYVQSYGYAMDPNSQHQGLYPIGMDGEGMPFAAGAAGATGAAAAAATTGSATRRRSAGPNGHEDQLLSPDVFADHSSSPENEPSPSAGGHAHNNSDHRLDRGGLFRANSNGSAHSLRDDQDYTRKVLALAN